MAEPIHIDRAEERGDVVAHRVARNAGLVRARRIILATAHAAQNLCS
jgi:hypothetical protein